MITCPNLEGVDHQMQRKTAVKTVQVSDSKIDAGTGCAVRGSSLVPQVFDFSYLFNLDYSGKLKWDRNKSEQKQNRCCSDIYSLTSAFIAKNETLLWPAESKTPEVQELSPQSLPGNHESILCFYTLCYVTFANDCSIYELKISFMSRAAVEISCDFSSVKNWFAQ